MADELHRPPERSSTSTSDRPSAWRMARSRRPTGESSNSSRHRSAGRLALAFRLAGARRSPIGSSIIVALWRRRPYWVRPIPANRRRTRRGCPAAAGLGAPGCSLPCGAMVNSDKRQRHKEGHRTRVQEAQAAAAKARRTRSFITVGIVAVVIIGAFVIAGHVGKKKASTVDAGPSTTCRRRPRPRERAKRPRPFAPPLVAHHRRRRPPRPHLVGAGAQATTASIGHTNGRRHGAPKRAISRVHGARRPPSRPVSMPPRPTRPACRSQQPTPTIGPGVEHRRQPSAPGAHDR